MKITSRKVECTAILGADVATKAQEFGHYDACIVTVLGYRALISVLEMPIDSLTAVEQCVRPSVREWNKRPELSH